MGPRGLTNQHRETSPEVPVRRHSKERRRSKDGLGDYDNLDCKEVQKPRPSKDFSVTTKDESNAKEYKIPGPENMREALTTFMVVTESARAHSYFSS